jgi:hypothetical protein
MTSIPWAVSSVVRAGDSQVTQPYPLCSEREEFVLKWPNLLV